MLKAFQTFMQQGGGGLLLPEMMLVLFAMGILLTDYLLEARDKYFNALMAMLGVIFSGICLWQLRGVADRGRRRLQQLAAGRSVFSVFRFHFPDRHGAGHHPFRPLSADRGRKSRRVLRPDAVRHGRHDVHGLRLRPDRAIPGPGNDGHQLLRPGGIPAARQAFERRRGEIPAAGRVQLGDSGLRLFDPLRDRRHGQPELYWRRRCLPGPIWT